MLDQLNKFADKASDTINDSIPSDFGGNFIETSDRVLDNVLDTNRRVVDFVVTTADRVNGEVSFELPFADRLPTPEEAGEAYLDFVERAVSANRDMNERIVDMINVDAPKAAKDASSRMTTATKSATKTVSKTATSAANTVKKAAPKTSSAKKAAPKRASAKKSTAKKSTARKTTAKKATKTSTAHKAAATK